MHGNNCFNNRTKLKNRVHRVIESESIKLSPVISDIFGKSGLHIIRGILEGIDPDTIISTIPNEKIRDKESEIRNVIQNILELSWILIIDHSLSLIESINRKIDEFDKEIEARMIGRERDLKVAMSVSGIGKISAMTILAEIGDCQEFDRSKKFAAWSGLISSIYQSAGHLKTGPITKRGSPHLRRVMVEVAQPIVKTKKSKLRAFFLRLKLRKGYNKAIVTVARKIICILWTILTKKELYWEDNLRQNKVTV